MRPRQRAATALLALALVGGAAGAAVGASAPTTPTGPPDGAAAVSAAGPVQTVPAPAPSASAPRAGAREGFAPSLALGAEQAAGQPVDDQVPVEVSVPRIGVDTPLLRLGIAADGSLEVPGRDAFDRAGWLTTSAVPGEPGAAVVAGHVDSTSGPAVFYRLHELVPGDEVRVRLADGAVEVFTVDEVRRVPKDAFPTAEVYGPQPGPVLRLVTCGGAFDRATGHYTDNVIAFASAA